MDIEALKRTIKPLDLSLSMSHSAEAQAYFEYYEINFADRLDRVTHHFGYIEHNQQKIACHYFNNRGATRTCFIVHGYLDHSGLYRKLIDYLLHRGCHVVVYDQPGHGLSDGETASIESFGDYVLVLRRVLEFFYRNTASPWYVVAQSMGAAVTMDYLLTQQVDEETGPFERVVLLAPLVRPAAWRRIRLTRAVLGVVRSGVRRRFTENSHDPGFVEFLQNEPLQSKRIPVQWVTAMVRWAKRFNQLSWSQSEVLVVQGTGDKTVAWKYNLKAILGRFPRAKFMRITDARHHLVGESDEYFERVTQAADIYFERRSQPREVPSDS